VHDTPLHWAASAGRVSIVRALLDSGANRHIANSAGFIPLDLAQEFDKEDCADLLRDPPYPPDAPNTISVTDTSITIMWTVPPDNGVLTTDYELVADPCAGSGIEEGKARRVNVMPRIPNIPTEPRSEITYTIEGLFTDTTYNITVRAKNAKGWSKFSLPLSALTGPSRPTTPGNPKVIHYTAIAAVLQWKSANPHGSRILGYELQWALVTNDNMLNPWIDSFGNEVYAGSLKTISNEEQVTVYSIGDEIEVRPAKNDTWLAAFISAKGHVENTYTVRYAESGEREMGVSTRNIRKPGQKQSMAAFYGLEVEYSSFIVSI
jgi:hypothetical protein